MRNPCKNCPNKGCGPYHDECERHKEFKLEKRKANSELRKLDACLSYLKYKHK